MEDLYYYSQNPIIDYISDLYDISFEGTLQTVVFDVVAINHDSIFNFFETKNDIRFVEYIFKEGQILSPYHPFLECIKKHFKNFEEEETLKVLEELKVYSEHQSLFMSYIYDYEFHRKQDLIYDEVYYERMLIVKSIANLMTYISEKVNIVCYLGQLHLSRESTIQALIYIMENCSNSNILFIVTYDTDSLDYEEERIIYNQFIETVEEADVLVQLESEFYSEDGMKATPALNKTESSRYMEACVNFLALEDCVYYGKILYSEYNASEGRLHSRDYVDLLMKIGLAYAYMSENESALFYHQMALNIVKELEDLEKVCHVYINIGYDYLLMKDLSNAYINCSQALDITSENIYPSLEYKSKFLMFEIQRQETFAKSSLGGIDIESLIRDTIDSACLNYLSHLYIYPQEFVYNRLREERLIEGINIAKNIGNDHQLGVAYHNLGVMYTNAKRRDEAYESYKLSEKIKVQIGNLQRLADNYNSLGYFYFLEEKFDKAHQVFCNSFDASCNGRDYHEAGMTLYNLAINSLFYGKYDNCIDYISKLLRLMKVTKTYDLAYHSRKTMYDIYIIALVKNNERSKAKDIYSKTKIWRLKTLEGKADEEVISKIVEFYMNLSTEVKENCLSQIEDLLDNSSEDLYALKKFFYIEKIIYYKSINSFYYKKVISTCLSLFNDKLSERTLDKLKQLDDNIVLIEFKQPKKELKSIEASYNHIIYRGKIDQNLSKLRHRISEINFINIVQNMLTSESTTKDVFYRLEKLILSNTKVEKIHCRFIKGKDYTNLNINDGKLVINEVYADRIYTYVKDRTKTSFIQTGNDSLVTIKKVYKYSSLMYLPIYSEGRRIAEFILMTQHKDLKLKQDDLEIFNLVGRHVGESVERLNHNQTLQEMNEKLQHLSKTDLLTNLYNRSALEAELQKEQQMVHAKLTKELMILFLDLDNFKYYNDTFGHSIGDQVLIRFAHILMKVLEKDDFVARFGGDEFVILIRNKDIAYGESVASKIEKAIEEDYHFQRIIGQLLGKRVLIPVDSQLSCSIGMTVLSERNNKDVDLMFKESDIALYQAKREGKNRLVKINNQ